MTDVSDLVGRIEKAFAWRAVPDHVLEAPLPGDEIEEGQTYGVIPLKENNFNFKGFG